MRKTYTDNESIAPGKTWSISILVNMFTFIKVISVRNNLDKDD